MACTIKRIIYLKTAINYQIIKIFDDNSNDVTDLCEFSWSHDNVCWTEWCNVGIYNKICKSLQGDFYLRIRTHHSIKGVQVGGVITNCYNITLDNTCVFLQNFCEDCSLFQPYNNLDCALYLQQQLADSVICMFGIPIYYIKCEPQAGTEDYTFKEYVMHNVVDIKQLKLMIPDGQMPSSNPKLSEFDFEWQTDWETELSKTQFAKAFGDTAIPMSRDMIYIPMMKRMWEINSAYDEKNEGLLWRSTTWKLSLIKYSDSTNVDSEGFDEIFDTWTSNMYQKMFGDSETNEQEKAISLHSTDSPQAAATNLYNIFMEDSIRKQYTKETINILDKNFYHKNYIFGRNIYKTKPSSLISYQKGLCGLDGTIMFMMETPGGMKEGETNNILKFGNIEVNISFKNNKFLLNCNKLSIELDQFNAYMVMVKWDKKNYISELIAYKYTHKQGIPTYMLKPEMYFLDFDNPIKCTDEYYLDWGGNKKLNCQITPFPTQMTNIKYYNKYLDFEEGIKESLRYTTNHENCVINDLARPIDAGHGYNVR